MPPSKGENKKDLPTSLNITDFTTPDSETEEGRLTERSVTHLLVLSSDTAKGQLLWLKVLIVCTMSG